MRPSERGEWTRGALGVSLLGGALGLGFAANFAWELRSLAVVWAPVAVFLLGTALSAGLAYAGVWLARREYGPGETRHVACWTASGAAILAAISAVSVLVRAAEGRPTGEPQLELLLSASAGGLAGVVAGHREVLARRERAEAERTRDTLAFLNRTLRHEMVNGIQLIGGHAGTLRERVDGDAAHAVETIETTSRELEELVEDVRLVADVHAGEADLEPVDVARVVRREAERVDAATPDATVETELPDGATARANDAVAHVFRNLLANAVEHTGDEPTVGVDLTVGDDALTVRVADDGPGIPDDRKEAVLEPDDDATHGFGLHLSRTLVEGYGGRLAVEDNDPEGAVFVVELPRPWSAAADAGPDVERDRDPRGGDVDDTGAGSVRGGADGPTGDGAAAGAPPDGDDDTDLRTNP